MVPIVMNPGAREKCRISAACKYRVPMTTGEPPKTHNLIIILLCIALPVRSLSMLLVFALIANISQDLAPQPVPPVIQNP
jgi:hypothetical protein